VASKNGKCGVKEWINNAYKPDRILDKVFGQAVCCDPMHPAKYPRIHKLDSTTNSPSAELPNGLLEGRQ